jgi:hypothetical protein
MHLSDQFCAIKHRGAIAQAGVKILQTEATLACRAEKDYLSFQGYESGGCIGGDQAMTQIGPGHDEALLPARPEAKRSGLSPRGRLVEEPTPFLEAQVTAQRCQIADLRGRNRTGRFGQGWVVFLDHRRSGYLAQRGQSAEV